jgi:hypothetical protein
VDAQDARVWFGIRGKSVEVEAGIGLVDALVQRLELLALKWDRPRVLVILDEHPVFLHIGDTE